MQSLGNVRFMKALFGSTDTNGLSVTFGSFYHALPDNGTLDSTSTAMVEVWHLAPAPVFNK